VLCLNKKAQVSIYLVVLVIVLGIFVFIIFQTKPSSKVTIQEEPDSVITFVEDTLELSTNHCLVKLGLQGGNFIPKVFLSESYADIEYSYSFEDTFLTEENLIAELEICINDVMPDCIDGFEDFKNIGLKINHSNLNSKIILARNDLPVSLTYDVSIGSGSKTREVNEFAINNLKVRLKNIHDAAKTLGSTREAQVKDSDLDLSYLGSIPMNSSIYEKENDKQITSIKDHESKIDGRDYVFVVASEFRS